MLPENCPVEPLVEDYLAHLCSQERRSTAALAANALTGYLFFLKAQGCAATAVTADIIAAYRLHLTTPEASRKGRVLATITQATHIAIVRAFYRWLRRRGMLVGDPTRDLHPPRIVARAVRKDYLDQQEAQAFLGTMAAEVGVEWTGTIRWARKLRDLAMIAVAIATGRRRAGLLDLRLADVDVERGELRVEREKGKVGRVLPMASWAAGILRVYATQARPLLVKGADLPWLFIGTMQGRVGDESYAALVRRIHDQTCRYNPDLRELRRKHITTHGLRVTCARLLFANGCPIRSINEILLHTHLSTTAKYTPIPVEELRRVLATTHPRA